MRLKYQLNEKPGFGPLLLYGLQWWVVTLPCLVIMGVVVARMHFDGLAEQIFYVQRLFGLMGLLTVVQVLWGHRLPLVMGPAAILLVGLVATVSAGLETVYTSIFIGGAAMFLAAVTGLLSRLRRLFTPRIVAVILILIAFTLSPTILGMIYGGAGPHSARLGFALVLVLLLVFCNVALPGVMKSLTVVIGMSLGSAVYFLLFGCPGLESPPAASAASLGASLFINGLAFDPGIILSFLFCFLALLINDFGSIESVGQLLKADHMELRVKRGLAVTGLANMAAGGLGVIGPVDFSLSAGVIAASGCASRYAFLPAGLGITACAFMPKVILLLTAIPGPVMGALLLYLMSTQLASGLGMLLAEKGVRDFDGALVVSLPLMIGLLISFSPAETFTALPQVFRPIVGNGFVMGTVMVLVLEHLVFRKRPPL